MKKIRMCLLALGLMVFVLFNCQSYAQTPKEPVQGSSMSTLIFPFSADLKAVETEINKIVPTKILNFTEPRKVCIPAKWTSWDYPCFKGIKMYRCKGKTKISPDLKCDLKGKVDRTGPVRVIGENQKITVSVPVFAETTAYNIGGIVRSETAKAAADVSISASIDLTPDWEPQVNIDAKYAWSKRPEIRLFDFIKITIGSKVEPKLNDMIKEHKEQLPDILRKLNIKQTVEDFWRNAQKPILVTKTPMTYLVVEPQSVTFPGFDINNNIVKGVVGVDTKLSLVVKNDAPTTNENKLPNLVKEEINEKGISINSPVLIDLDSITSQLNNEFPKGFDIDLTGSGLEGEAKITNVKLTSDRTGLKLDMGLEYDTRSGFMRVIDVFDWFAIEGVLSFKALPKVDMNERLLTLTSLKYDSVTSNEVFDGFVTIAKLPIIKNLIERHISYNFSKNIDDLKTVVNKSLNTKIGEFVSLYGRLDDIEFAGLEVSNNQIKVLAKLLGEVEVRVDNH